MRRNASRHAPTAPPRPPLGRPSHSPPCSRQISSARSQPRARRVVGRLEAEHEQRVRPSPAPVCCASSASIRRQLAGSSPDWASARTASAPRGERRRSARARAARCGRPRLHAHPRLGDHAEDPLRAEQQPVGRRAGARAGQAARLPRARRRDRADGSTRSSMWVRRVAKWPPARVAIQPPSVESSNDCGKKRSVRPCAASCSSSARAARAAPMRAARETASTSSSPSSAPRSSDRAVEARRDARLDAADDARAAAVAGSPRRCARRPLEHLLHLALVARARDEVGRVLVARRGSARTVSR